MRNSWYYEKKRLIDIKNTYNRLESVVFCLNRPLEQPGVVDHPRGKAEPKIKG